MAEKRRQSTAHLKQISASMREHARNRKIAGVFLLFLGLIVAFVLGFLLRSDVALMSSLGFNLSDTVEANKGTVAAKSSYDSIGMRVSEVEEMLETQSMDTIDLTDATKSMLNDLLASTQDPYAAYYDSERYESYIKETSEKGYLGVGVLFGDYDGRAYVIDVMEGSQAEARGVQRGDFVQAIDGESEHTWSASEVIGALSRENDQNVVITWMRPISIDAQRGHEFTTTLTYKDYDIPNVTKELYDNVGYISLKQITANSASLIKAAIVDLTAQGAQAFVLDVRDNPGGYLTQSLDIASLFVQSGVLVGIETKDGVNTRTATGTTLTSAPVVVLMNNYTAAAAEVLVAALQDNQRATTLGQKTMGKGSVQVVRELSFGGAVKYTAAYYVTPLGHQINGVGIMPDIAVAGNDPQDSDNSQKLIAIDSARSLLEGA